MPISGEGNVDGRRPASSTIDVVRARGTEGSASDGNRVDTEDASVRVEEITGGGPVIDRKNSCNMRDEWVKGDGRRWSRRAGCARREERVAARVDVGRSEERESEASWSPIKLANGEADRTGAGWGVAVRGESDVGGW